ncbi:20444_t:CDS:2, partial [Entrophospora sp. SA101]
GFDLFLSFKLPLSKKQIAQRKNFKNRSNNSSTGQFEESKVSDSSGSDFILSDEIYSSDSIVPEALNSVSLTTIHHYAQKSWRYMEREFQED